MKVLNGKLEGLEEFEGKEVEVRLVKNIRSAKQNNALHLYLSQWAELLREHGIDMEMILKDGHKIPPTTELLKEEVWRKIQIAMFNKQSTTELSTDEINKIYDVITKTFGERYHLFVPWPCIETLENENTTNFNN